MRAHLLRMGALIAASVLSACGHSSSDSIDGNYRLPNGNFVDISGSEFRAGSSIPSGSVLVSGSTVTVRLTNGTQLEGTRVDADHIRILKQNGALIPPLELVREGSVALPSAAPAISATSASQAAPSFTPDPSVPLDAYTPLHSQSDLAWVALAFQSKPVSDDQLLAMLGTKAGNLNDAFAKRDIATRELSALHARLEHTREQRYYSVEFGVPEKGAAPDTFRLYTRFLEPYDFTHHAFALQAMGDAPCWDTIGPLHVAHIEGVCALSVPDESKAREIESLRSTMTALFTKGTVFFCVTEDARGNRPAQVTVMRTRLTVSSFNDPAFTYSGEF